MLAPIPFDAPVTTATFPSSFFDMCPAPPCSFRCDGCDDRCGRPGLRLPPQPRVEQVAQPVPEEVDPELREQDREPREDGDPTGHRQVIAALGQHPTPG